MPPFRFLPGFLSLTEAQALYDELTSENDYSRRTIQLEGMPSFELGTGYMAFLEPDLDEPETLQRHFFFRTSFGGLLSSTKSKLEAETGHQYQVCVTLLYDSGETGINFHQDFTAYGDVDSIPSLNLGAAREFVIRKVSDHTEVHKFTMKSGDLVIMEDGCQEEYEHALLVDESITEPRLNLTFRKYAER